MKFIDDKCKKVKWWNRNYFYFGTIAIIAVNIMLFAFLGNHFETVVQPDLGHHWHDGLYFVPTLRVFLNAFSHSDWEHVLLNMLCFAFVGLYFERKMGTFGLLGFVIVGAYFSGIAVATNNLSVNYHGFSGVNYLCYAYVIVDYIFSFQKDRRNKTNTILGALVLVAIYVSMCFSDSLRAFPFTYYPIDLITNLGHGSSFVVGLVLALIIQISMLIGKRRSKD